MTSSRPFSQGSSQTFSLTNQPETVCLLRLSALGDITHVLPTLRTLQTHWPKTKITWIIGRLEYQLVKDIQNVDFIIFDKKNGIAAYTYLKKQLKNLNNGKAFDILFHMQLSIRASVASLFIPAQIKLGFDKARAKDFQSLFCNQQITPHSTRQHVLDSFLEFPKHFGLEPVLKWQLPVSETATAAIQSRLSTEKKIFVINPCAVAKSKNWRNWTNERYAAVADYINDSHNMTVVLTGGTSQLEKETGNEILAQCKTAQPVNLIASTTIAELVAILNLAEIVLAPDTGPVHIASALNTKTIGLYAATNPDRAGPYNHREFVANKYPEALLQYHQKNVTDVSWGKRIKTAECMKLISIDDVIKQINKLI